MRLINQFAGLVVVFILAACSGTPGGDGGTGGGRTGGGSGGGGALTQFNLIDLDPTAREATHFAMTYDAAAERIGVAYFTPNGTQAMGTPNYDLKYVEYKQGVVSTPQVIRYVQRKIGVSLVFEPATGEPMVASLGGAEGFVPGESIYWFQSDAVINKRSGGSTWTEQIIVATGGVARCNNPVSDRGLLVGMWPSLALDSAGKMYFAYRDGHDGQFGPQDSWGADLELFEGTFPSLTGRALLCGGNNKQAWGGHNQLVMGANNQPAIVSDQMFLGWDTAAQNVIFQHRNTDGTWTPADNRLSIANTQTGPSLAWDSQAGYGIAVVDRSSNELSFIDSKDGSNWSSPDPVFGSGAGGWYPSLAMDPMNHEPAIAFYVCSPNSATAETACPTSADELRITQRNAVSNRWNETLVDTGGGYAPKLGFFGNVTTSRRFVVYRVPPALDPGTGLTVPNAGALRLAVER